MPLRCPTLEELRADELPETPGVWVGFELCEVAFDLVLFVLAVVEYSELVASFHFTIRLVGEIDRHESGSFGCVAFRIKLHFPMRRLIVCPDSEFRRPEELAV